MGAAASGLRQANVLLEYLAVGPGDLPAALQPLLSLSLAAVCRAYRHFGGAAFASVEEVAEELQLDLKAARQLAGGQRRLPTLELLTMLVLASRTHALTKARLLFSLCDGAGQGHLQLEQFLQAMSAFLVAAVRLGSGTRRPELPRKNLLDSLAFGLFRAHDPEMSKEAFLKMTTAQDHVGRLLRRFARGAPDEAFQLPPWQELASNKGGEEASAPLVHAVSAVSARSGVSGVSRQDVLDGDAPLPRRKGYFLAVQSSWEVALFQQLETVQKLRRTDQTVHGALELEMQEREIREKLLGEMSDEVGRREYRRRLQKLWHRSRPSSACSGKGVVCQRRLWTASSCHVARGGVLPSGVPRPLTPKEVQAAVNSVVSSSGLPSRTIEERVRQEFGTSQEPREPREREQPRRPSTARSAKVRRASWAGTELECLSQAETVERGEAGGLYRKADVLLAFDLYRQDYWLREGGGVRSLLRADLPLQPRKDMTPGEKAERRRAEIELMLKEVAEEKPAATTPSASTEMTLRGFFKSVFPFAKKTDIKTMLYWVQQPPTDDKAKARQVSDAKPDFGLLRDLIDLFDAIDSFPRTHSVPIEAVEQFLSGEIITQGETAKLRQRRMAQTGQRSVTAAACYPQNPRVALILDRMLEDRVEWQVTLPEGREGREGREKKAGWRSLESHMETLAATLDGELHDLAHGDENLLTESIEAACNPWHHHDYVERAELEEGRCAEGAPRKVRLVRLYWRYMIGSAVVQQLRDEPTRLMLKDGKLDLLGFMCVLAQDQVRAIFPLSRPTPSEAQIRRLAYAFE